MAATPWAILKCKFSDDNSEPETDAFYDALFTTAGNGTLNMTTFFDEVSHGALDLSGSQVFGWYTLDQKQSDYKGSGPNPQGRQDLVDWAKAKAVADGVVLTDFYGVVVTMNVSTDLFGGWQQAVCDKNSLVPSALGQEMGHGYGLDHSRMDGSNADYQDQWDIMSTASAYSAADTDYTSVGPGLNAANMRGRGWLDETRVWKNWSDGANDIVTLRPVHRRDLPGYLAAEIGEYLIEFRPRARWDSAIPWPCVLIHRFADNRSYLMSGSAGQQTLTAGATFERGNPSPVDMAHSYIRVDVDNIDGNANTATLHLQYRKVDHHHDQVGPGTLFGGVGVDGGGWILLGGTIIHIPPHSPLLEALSHIALIETSDLATDRDLRSSLKLSAAENLMSFSRRVAEKEQRG